MMGFIHCNLSKTHFAVTHAVLWPKTVFSRWYSHRNRISRRKEEAPPFRGTYPY